MRIFTKKGDLAAFLTSERLNKHSIGFVPTMGALHQGHLSLIEVAKKTCQICVCSIFVNPNQFNDKEDLKKYPRTPEADIQLLESVMCDVLFMPEVDEIYPQEDKSTYQFGHLDSILEGAHRPGHFNGVAQVVRRLFDILKPDSAFFGSKDYQQVMVVKSLVAQLHFQINIVACPILREADGLAMSSRNTLLGVDERKIAGMIPGIMRQAVGMVKKGEKISSAKAYVKAAIAENALMRLEYFEICDASNLKLLQDNDVCEHRIALIAVYVGKIRLIDNFSIEESE